MLHIHMFLHGVFPSKPLATVGARVVTHTVVDELYVLGEVVMTGKGGSAVGTTNTDRVGSVDVIFVSS